MILLVALASVVWTIAPESVRPAAPPVSRAATNATGSQLETEAVDTAAAPGGSYCWGSSSATKSLEMANALLANRYTLAPHPTVTLPSSLTWREDPLRDDNWKFQFHSLRFVKYLLDGWRIRADVRYRDRARYILADWYHDNPRSAPASPWAWNDHATAFRATVYACAYVPLGRPTWLRDALLLHGRVLADPSFYVHHGNHALNQAVGLLDVGCLLGRSDWTSLARDRLGRLIPESVDAQGATNEQAVAYQLYNYTRYVVARQRLAACTWVPSSFSRVALMPPFLAHATLPNGRYEMLGDTEDRRAASIAGTTAEYAASLGASGPKPGRRLAVYSAGFVFGRSGWGESRPYQDEVAFTMRFGPARAYHGHFDGGQLTVYGYGSRLLLDSGKFTYNSGPYRTYFRGRSASNVVTVDGVAFNAASRTYRTASRWSTTHFDVALKHYGYAGVESRRRVIFSRRLNYLIVEDRLISSSWHRYRQLWHLREDAAPSVSGSTVSTRRTRGNVLIRQLYGSSTVRLVKGATDPIQGWLSYRYNSRLANPTAEVLKTGSSVRYLTLIVPGADAAFSVGVRSLSVRSDGYTVLVTVDGKTERVTVTANGSSIEPLS